MTKTEKLLLALTAVFFFAAAVLLPQNTRGSTVEPVEIRPGPTPEGAELVVVLRQEIDINTADAKELTALPGVGSVLAEAIVAYREEHGPFHSLDELLEVEGVRPTTLDAILREADPGTGEKERNQP